LVKYLLLLLLLLSSSSSLLDTVLELWTGAKKNCKN